MKFSLLVAVISSIAGVSALFTPAVTVKLVLDDLVKLSTQFTTGQGASVNRADEVASHAVNTMFNGIDAEREELVLAHDYAPGSGPCHPYPGAVASDCLSLISENLGNKTALPCINNQAIMIKGDCLIISTCNSAGAAGDGVIPYLAARRALTTIGSCALQDYGSISGYYVSDEGVKTCYLYPGHESYCK